MHSNKYTKVKNDCKIFLRQLYHAICAITKYIFVLSEIQVFFENWYLL